MARVALVCTLNRQRFLAERAAVALNALLGALEARIHAGEPWMACPSRGGACRFGHAVVQEVARLQRYDDGNQSRMSAILLCPPIASR